MKEIDQETIYELDVDHLTVNELQTFWRRVVSLSNGVADPHPTLPVFPQTSLGAPDVAGAGPEGAAHNSMPGFQTQEALTKNVMSWDNGSSPFPYVSPGISEAATVFETADAPLTDNALDAGSVSAAVGAAEAMCSPTLADDSCDDKAAEATGAHSAIDVAKMPDEIEVACSGDGTPRFADKSQETCPPTLVNSESLVDTNFMSSPLLALPPRGCEDSMLSEVKIARPVI